MELFTQLFGDLLAFVYHCFDRIVIYGSSESSPNPPSPRPVLARRLLNSFCLRFSRLESRVLEGRRFATWSCCPAAAISPRRLRPLPRRSPAAFRPRPSRPDKGMASRMRRRIRAIEDVTADELLRDYSDARFGRLLLYLLVLRNKAVDWDQSGYRIAFQGNELVSGFSPQFHHIFPRGFLTDKAIGKPQSGGFG